MSLQRTYRRVCDGCGVVHKAVCDTARRSLAAMRRDGWVRRNVGAVHQGEHGVWQEWGPWRDFCPACAEREGEQ